jgi:hypothetical protein
MKMKLLMLSTGAALLMSPMWAQEQEKSPTTAAQTQESSMKSWTGTLHDADCKPSTPQEKCEVTSSTRTFSLMTADGKSAKLDSDGNTKVRTALRAQKGSAAIGAVKASITGSIDREMIKVDSVKIL